MIIMDLVGKYKWDLMCRHHGKEIVISSFGVMYRKAEVIQYQWFL